MIRMVVTDLSHPCAHRLGRALQAGAGRCFELTYHAPGQVVDVKRPGVADQLLHSPALAVVAVHSGRGIYVDQPILRIIRR